MPSSSLGGIFFAVLPIRAAGLQLALPGGASSRAPAPVQALVYAAPIITTSKGAQMHAAIRSAAILACLFGAVHAQAADLTIRIDNVDSNDGQLMVALYNGAGWMKQPLQTASVEAVAGTTTVQFKDLPPGEYAFAVFHDANGNGRLDRNRMGMPVEMSTFSNDAQGFMGPAPFEAARFALPAAGRSMAVNLR
jgi:uncharacterized protein (DUF2141 family)